MAWRLPLSAHHSSTEHVLQRLDSIFQSFWAELQKRGEASHYLLQDIAKRNGEQKAGKSPLRSDIKLPPTRLPFCQFWMRTRDSLPHRSTSQHGEMLADRTGLYPALPANTRNEQS
ncbi:Hypothetical predicted protein, partial [Pelobates cultripes]